MKILTTLIFTSLILTSNLFAQSSEQDWTYNTSPGMTADIELTNCDIQFIEGYSSQVQIKLEVSSNENLSEYEIFESSGGFVIKQNSIVRSSRNPLSDKITVKIPQYYNLKIKTASGDIDISGIEGYKNISVASSDINIKNSNGDIKINSASGDIEILNSNGSKDIKTASGDIFIRESLGKSKLVSASGDIFLNKTDESIDAVTASGDIKIFPLNNVRDISVKSMSGDISIDVRNISGITLKAKTLTGELDLIEDFRVVESDKKIGKSITAVSGDGIVTVECNNVSGDIKITR